MPGKIGTRSEFIEIPGSEWAARDCGVAPAEIAAIALAIERRRFKRVLLPNEASRYAVVCDRLAEIALELLDQGIASRIWTADSTATSLWAMLSYSLIDRLRLRQRDPSWDYLPRLLSTFFPPADTAGVAGCLEQLAQVEAIGWEDRSMMIPILEARRDVCANAAADGTGLIEVVKLSYC
jgi:hypothetical protein